MLRISILWKTYVNTTKICCTFLETILKKISLKDKTAASFCIDNEASPREKSYLITVSPNLTIERQDPLRTHCWGCNRNAGYTLQLVTVLTVTGEILTWNTHSHTLTLTLSHPLLPPLSLPPSPFHSRIRLLQVDFTTLWGLAWWVPTQHSGTAVGSL